MGTSVSFKQLKGMGKKRISTDRYRVEVGSKFQISHTWTIGSGNSKMILTSALYG